MIELDGVTKTYRVYRKKSDWLKEKLVRRRLHQPKTALHDINLRVGTGEVFGVIGRNGSGKSTLLKLVMGVALPDAGAVRVSGRVTGLLELGTGFNSDLSGARNIDFNAALLGMTPAEVAERREDIIAFSELGEAIHDPLRTYSSGMTMRLAFSIAIHAAPACFVVDEALSVGDVHFQQKCLARIREFKQQGGSIMFVSHDINAVKMLCDRAAVLENGRLLAEGTPEEVANNYNRIIAEQDAIHGTPTRAPAAGRDETPPGGGHGFGNGDVTILSGRIAGDVSGGPVVDAGETATIEITARANRDVPRATLGFILRDKFGQDVYGTNTHCLGHSLSLKAGETRCFRFRMPLNIGLGHYSLTAAFHRDVVHTDKCYHWYDRLARFEVSGFRGPRFTGVCRLDPVFSDADAASEAGEEAVGDGAIEHV